MKTRKKSTPVPITSKPRARDAGSSPSTPKAGTNGTPPVPITSQWDVNGTQPLKTTPTTEARRHGEKQNGDGRRLKSGKAAVPPKPTQPRLRRKPAFTLKQERDDRFRSLTFPEVEGKKTAAVQMITSDDYHAVVIVFDDNTAVGFEIEPCFTVRAFAGDIDGVGPGANKTWPEIRSERRE